MLSDEAPSGYCQTPELGIVVFRPVLNPTRGKLLSTPLSDKPALEIVSKYQEINF
jgi:hypothetical protein